MSECPGCGFKRDQDMDDMGSICPNCHYGITDTHAPKPRDLDLKSKSTLDSTSIA